MDSHINKRKNVQFPKKKKKKSIKYKIDQKAQHKEVA